MVCLFAGLSPLRLCILSRGQWQNTANTLHPRNTYRHSSPLPYSGDTCVLVVGLPYGKHGTRYGLHRSAPINTLSFVTLFASVVYCFARFTPCKPLHPADTCAILAKSDCAQAVNTQAPAPTVLQGRALLRAEWLRAERLLHRLSVVCQPWCMNCQGTPPTAPPCTACTAPDWAIPGTATARAQWAVCTLARCCACGVWLRGSTPRSVAVAPDGYIISHLARGEKMLIYTPLWG